MVEDGETKCLTLSVSPQICFKAKGINGRNEGLYDVQWRARNWCILGHVTSVMGKCSRMITLQTLLICDFSPNIFIQPKHGQYVEILVIY